MVGPPSSLIVCPLQTELLPNLVLYSHLSYTTTMTMYSARLEEDQAFVQLSSQQINQAVQDRGILLLKEILALFPEQDVSLTPNAQVQAREALLKVLTRKPTRPEKNNQLIVEHLYSYNTDFNNFTASFVYAYKQGILRFKYSVDGKAGPSRILSEDLLNLGRWQSYKNGEITIHPSPLSENETPLQLLPAPDVVLPSKSKTQVEVEMLLDGLYAQERKLRTGTLSIEQEHVLDSTMASCQQIETLISGSRDFATEDQQEKVYSNAIPALDMLAMQLDVVRQELNADVLRELTIMQGYLVSKHSNLTLPDSSE